MEEVRKSITPQEQILLADFWEDKPTLHALQKALLQRQYQLAINTMAAAPNWENVVQNRGKVEEDKFIVQFLELNFKEVNKRRNKAK
jgi:hypothetical protein